MENSTLTTKSSVLELIDTLWNVNRNAAEELPGRVTKELIDTLWNVN